MDCENHLEKNPIQKIEKTVKIKVKSPHVKKSHKRESEFLFKQFSHSKSLLQFDLKNHENM